MPPPPKKYFAALQALGLETQIYFQHYECNISSKCFPLSVTMELPLESPDFRRVLIELIGLMLLLMLEHRSYRFSSDTAAMCFLL